MLILRAAAVWAMQANTFWYQTAGRYVAFFDVVVRTLCCEVMSELDVR